jgi:hypothetical protein
LKAIREPTPELIREISDSISTGMFRIDAAEFAGVVRETFADWMRRAEDGIEPYLSARSAFSKAELGSQRRLLTKLSLAAANDPKYAAWLLAHRWPKTWREGVSEKPPVSAGTRSGPAELKLVATRILGHYPLLSWEVVSEFEELVMRLLLEHLPQGPTEEHLVEELAGVFLRKDRLRLAETASHRSGLKSAVTFSSGTVKAALAHLEEDAPETMLMAALTCTDEEATEQLAEAEAGEAKAEKAVAILESKKADRYRLALTALGDMQEWWEEELADQQAQSSDSDEEDTEGEEVVRQPRYEANVKSLLVYLQWQVLPHHKKRIVGLGNRSLIRQQAFGQAFEANDLENLSRIEAALDRKMVTTLDQLLRLQDRRHHRLGRSGGQNGKVSK